MCVFRLAFIVVIREVGAHLVAEVQRSFAALLNALIRIVQYKYFDTVERLANTSTFVEPLLRTHR